MNPRRALGSWVRCIVFAALCLSGVACTTPHMAVPSDVASATESVAVEGRSMSSGLFVNEDFKIGPFDVTNVSRGAKHASHFGAFGGFKSTEESGFSYDLKRGDLTLHGECTLDSGKSGANLGVLTIGNEHKKFACGCGNEKTAVASVIMTASTASKYGGTLKAHDSSYDLAAVYDREGAISDGNPSGYRVDGEGVQGAVDVLGAGRMWLSKTLEGDRRTDVTCVFAGLLLFKPGSEK